MINELRWIQWYVDMTPWVIQYQYNVIQYDFYFNRYYFDSWRVKGAIVCVILLLLLLSGNKHLFYVGIKQKWPCKRHAESRNYRRKYKLFSFAFMDTMKIACWAFIPISSGLREKCGILYDWVSFTYFCCFFIYIFYFALSPFGHTTAAVPMKCIYNRIIE